MKLLMIYCNEFSYLPQIKTLEESQEVKGGEAFEDALVAFIHAEEKDELSLKSIENKLLKNLKWAAKKNNTSTVILHSFAHLAETKANPHVTLELFNKVEERMKNTNYNCSQTAFGYFMDLDLKAPGISQARIFKDL